MAGQPAGIIFDVDGTLYRSERSAVQAYQGAVAALNVRHDLDLPIPSVATVHGYMGYRSDQIQDMLRRGPCRDHVEELWGLIVAHERKIIYSGNGELFPGVLEMLIQVRERGIAIGIYSNAPPWYFYGILDTYGISPYADFRSCIGEHPGWDKVDLLQHIKEGLGCEKVWVVGDRHHDIDAARTLGDVSVGCAYGYGGSEVETAQRILRRPMDLLTLLDQGIT